MRIRFDARRPLHVGALAAVATAGYMVWTASRGSASLTTFHDASTFVAVAKHPFGGVDRALDPLMGTAYRYGRIGFPLLGWLLASGQAAAVPFMLGTVFALSVGAVVGLAGHLAGDGRLGLLVLATPFTVVWLQHPMLVADPLAIAAVLAAYAAHRKHATVLAVVLAAFAILTRETTVLALAPLAAHQLAADPRTNARRWATVVAVVATWYVVVASRTGYLPFTDPAPSRRYATGGPFSGLRTLLDIGPDAAQRLGMVAAAATVGLAAVVVLRRRLDDPLVVATLLGVLAIPFLGPLVWGVPEDAHRVLWTVQVLGVCALTAAPARRRHALQRTGSLGGSPRRGEPVTLAS